MAKFYCYVEESEIIEGPRYLPTSWKNTSGLDLLDDAGLKLRGWLPYVDSPPSYNSDTQYLTSEKVISENAVTETYTINDYTSEEMTQGVADARAAKKKEVRALARQEVVKAHKWVVDKATAIDALDTLQAIRDYSVIAPDYDTVAANALAAIASSGIADMTYTELDTWIDNNVENCDPSVKAAIKKVAKAALALMKIQMGNE